MADSLPRVFTLPPSVDFLRALARALLDGRLVPGFHPGADPEALAAATIYLPTRRACRLAADVFLEVLGRPAALLPRLAPIGDIDEDELIFAEASGALDAAMLDLPPAIDPLARRMLLTRLILRWTRSPGVGETGDAPLVAATPAAALALADDLARLIDDMITRQVPWEKLDGFVPDHLDYYWRLTLDFLKIAREVWPSILAERGVVELAERRDSLITAEAERLRAHPGPVIAAGSTASMPATAKLLSAIARLPHGAVVLPGLDLHLDEPSWGLIGSDAADGQGAASIVHPQYAMQRFLAGLNMRRSDVGQLVPETQAGRERLVSEALRPAQTTDLWSRRDPGADAEGLAPLAVIEAQNAEDEALSIAVALREAEHEGKSAALVTPDRALARRVMSALARWHVAYDDSAGDPVAQSPAGVFARLVAAAALEGLEPVTLAALLKHPLLRLGQAAGEQAAAVRALELAVLRGPRPAPQTRGLGAALASLREMRLHPADSRAQLTVSQLDAAGALAQRVAAAVAPLEGAAPTPRPLSDWAARHLACVAAMSGDGATSVALTGADGEALLEMLQGACEIDPTADFPIAGADYLAFFDALLQGRSVRQRPNRTARIRIFGLLEARLQHPDRVVLGGLTEGVWPPQTRSDPWLSRPMRHALGLDLPERRIGLTAHDFAQALGCEEVILSRAHKLGGAPTVPSRFVQRLAAVAGKEAWTAACERGARYVAWAQALDRPAGITPVQAPKPRPPLAARPTRLSVTEIESWLRDPYTIYAKHVLRLRPLDGIDVPPDARDRGGAVHQAIEDFTKASRNGLPPEPLPVLLALGEKAFERLQAFPEAQAFWWPRFRRIAGWFAEWEQARRGDITELLAEVRGETALPMGEGTFTLTCRADRIERRTDGTLALIDYKTGQVATAKQVREGLAPQLTLEAAIAQRGGFPGVPKGSKVAALMYVQLRGGEPPGKQCDIGWPEDKDTSVDAEAARAIGRLATVVARFAEEDTPYQSLLHPMWKTRYGDYDHLARVKEWSSVGGEAEAGGDA